MSLKLYLNNTKGGYQPEGPSKEPKNPPKGGSGVIKLTDSLVEETLIDRIIALEKRVSALENKKYEIEYHLSPIQGTFIQRPKIQNNICDSTKKVEEK